MTVTFHGGFISFPAWGEQTVMVRASDPRRDA